MPMQVGDVAHELARGEAARHGFVLGYQRHAAVHLPVAPWIAAFDPHRALVDTDQPGDRPHERGLARAVRPEQTR